MNAYQSPWHVARRIFAVVFALYMVMPLVVIIVASLTNAGYVQFPPAAWGMRWYAEVFRNEYLMNGLIFSVQIATAVAVISGILGVAAAMAIARTNFPNRDALVALLTMPLAVPHVVLALALLQIFALLQVATSPWGLAAGHVLITLPYVLR